MSDEQKECCRWWSAAVMMTNVHHRSARHREGWGLAIVRMLQQVRNARKAKQQTAASCYLNKTWDSAIDRIRTLHRERVNRGCESARWSAVVGRLHRSPRKAANAVGRWNSVARMCCPECDPGREGGKRPKWLSRCLRHHANEIHRASMTAWDRKIEAIAKGNAMRHRGAKRASRDNSQLTWDRAISSILQRSNHSEWRKRNPWYRWADGVASNNRKRQRHKAHCRQGDS